MIDETADAIILRWSKPPLPAPQPKGRTIRQRLTWLAFPIWLVRLMVEGVGWLAVIGLITRL